MNPRHPLLAIPDSSRINTTKKLIAYLETLENKPKLLISGSAIGYYGIDKTDAVIEEKDNGDNSFSSELCQKWEATALPPSVPLIV
jgi:NAD dependent epimerase/dehydratase family enzyme